MVFDSGVKCFEAFGQLGRAALFSLRHANLTETLSELSSNAPFHFHCFDTLLFLPTLHSFPFSNSYLLFDPFSQLGNACVNPRLVPTCTALTPTDNAGLEPLPTLLEAHQGSSRVSLMITAKVSHWDWMWKIAVVLKVSPGMRRPLRLRIRCRASWR